MADTNNDQMTPEQIEAKRVADEATASAAATKAAEEAAAAAIKAAEEEAQKARDASKSIDQRDKDMIEKLVQDRLDVQLAGIKKSLDSAYKQRDEAAAKLAALEAKEKEANFKKLEEEGRLKEAYEGRLAEARAQLEIARKQNVELSRDVTVREALKGYSFRNDKASEMAFKEITATLVQNEQGQWVHRSGISVKDYCEAFSKDEEQSFLFKNKPNSGAGTSATSSGSGTPATEKPKSLFDLPQAEVIKMAAEGKLGRLPTI